MRLRLRNRAITAVSLLLSASVWVAGCGVVPTSSGTPAPARQATGEQNKSAAPSSRKLPRIAAAYTAISGGQVPLWIAEEKGLFEKYGLKVKLSYLVGPTATQALLAGDIQVGQIAAPPLVAADLRGSSHLTMIAGAVNIMVYSMYAVPGIQRMEDLRGKTVGISKFGGASDFATVLALKRFGLEPGKGVSLVQTGGFPEVVAAMKSGVVQAGAFPPPITVKAREAGFKEILNVTDLKIPFTQIGLAVRRSYLKAHRGTIEKFLKAYLEGIKVALTDKAYTKKVLAKYTKTTDERQLEDTYQNYIDKALTKVPYVTSAGIQTALNGLNTASAKAAKPGTFFDNSLVKGLEDGGFIRGLYQSSSAKG
ncbi:MAG: ABC transporter substrate-binding protein [Chloroflexota bacterium]